MKLRLRGRDREVLATIVISSDALAVVIVLAEAGGGQVEVVATELPVDFVKVVTNQHGGRDDAHARGDLHDCLYATEEN